MQQFLIVYLLLIFVHSANSHGRLIYPASRNALWRFGFKALKNRNDNQLNCGGFDIQWKKNLGKCGVCGDPFHLKAQPHIFPGKYAKAVITKEYSRGQEIVVGVELTSNHQGWFEFRIGEFLHGFVYFHQRIRLKCNATPPIFYSHWQLSIIRSVFTLSGPAFSVDCQAQGGSEAQMSKIKVTIN